MFIHVPEQKKSAKISFSSLLAFKRTIVRIRVGGVRKLIDEQPKPGKRAYLVLGSDVTKVINLPLVYNPKATHGI